MRRNSLAGMWSKGWSRESSKDWLVGWAKCKPSASINGMSSSGGDSSVVAVVSLAGALEDTSSSDFIPDRVKGASVSSISMATEREMEPERREGR